jgi:hypothetical protein
MAYLSHVSWQLGLVHEISLYFLWQCIHYSLWMALHIIPHSQQCKVGTMGPNHKLLFHVAPAMSKKVKKRSCWRNTLFPFPKDETKYHKLSYLIECLVVLVKQHLFTCTRTTIVLNKKHGHWISWLGQQLINLRTMIEHLIDGRFWYH